jgi:membrane-bound metal-dependent hydrolase YbcI (DUF457 family)
MPMTPLHFGVLAPLNRLAPGKVSAVSFGIGQILLDAESIRFYLTGYGDISHTSHTLFGALVLGAAISLPGYLSARWVWGAFVGTFSHVLLDALVHTDVELLAPWVAGNALYMGLMEPLSITLLALCVWLGLQKMSDFRRWVETAPVPAVASPQKPAPSEPESVPLDQWPVSLPLRLPRLRLSRAACLLLVLCLPALI